MTPLKYTSRVAALFLAIYTAIAPAYADPPKAEDKDAKPPATATEEKKDANGELTVFSAVEYLNSIAGNKDNKPKDKKDEPVRAYVHDIWTPGEGIPSDMKRYFIMPAQPSAIDGLSEILVSLGGRVIKKREYDRMQKSVVEGGEEYGAKLGNLVIKRIGHEVGNIAEAVGSQWFNVPNPREIEISDMGLSEFFSSINPFSSSGSSDGTNGNPGLILPFLAGFSVGTYGVKYSTEISNSRSGLNAQFDAGVSPSVQVRDREVSPEGYARFAIDFEAFRLLAKYAGGNGDSRITAGLGGLPGGFDLTFTRRNGESVIFLGREWNLGSGSKKPEPKKN